MNVAHYKGVIFVFYEQLLHLCEKNGVKPTPLAKELGFSAGNLKRWENGATVNSDILLTISKHFKVSVDYLLTGKEPTAPQKTADRELLELIENLSSEEREKAKTFIRFMLSERSSGSSERSDPDTSYEAKEEAV